MQITVEFIEKYELGHLFKPVYFEKNEVITSAGQQEKYIYYIKEGLVRFYVLSENGKECTYYFAGPGEFASAFISLKIQHVSKTNLQAVSKVLAMRVSYHQYAFLKNKHSKFTAMLMEVFDELITKITLRKLELLEKNPEKMYTRIINENPYLINNALLKHIASYIGITPQALSQIRKRVFKRKTV